MPSLSVSINGNRSALFTDYFAAIIDFAIKVGPLIAFVMFSYAAFLYFFSGGEESKTKEAKEIAIGVITGYAVIVSIKLLVTFLVG